MTEYKEKFEEWQKKAKETFEEIDNKLKEKIEESAKILAESAQKGAEGLREGIDRVKDEAMKSEVGRQAVKLAEDVVKVASDTAKSAWETSEPIRHIAEEATEKASEVFNLAKEKVGEAFGKTKEEFNQTAERISRKFEYGTSFAGKLNSTMKTVKRTANWVAENPLNAVLSGFSMVIGAGLGAGMTIASSHWFFNSALPVWSLRKIGEKFTDYLKNQENLLQKEQLDTAERERIKFERDIARYVGAPLLGSFSFAAGAMMWANIFSPGRITGAPISWILRGNPVLEGVWLFGNGLVCFKIGYEFFMFFLEDKESEEELIKKIKALMSESNVEAKA
ncbi:MAG: hypothetical protein N2Z23_00455 [Pyrinomonadaceae bacterium]|nr:hypothetical protein [Pyrinomonadaceae bacterium]MCX7638904.1 hypothetical protein [Pyrinomonadaceae bacterium]MDW8304959.1 hypothetical protein [Acidobacteriota bacterium]